MRVGVLLAAGASSRMGKDKALVHTRGMSFLAHGVRHLWSACESVVVVLGAHANKIRDEATTEFEKLVSEGRLHEDLITAHAKGGDGLEVRFAENPAWRSGMYGSVKVGLQHAIQLRPTSILVLPVDHPSLKETTVLALAAAMESALAAYGDGAGSPPKGRKGARKPAKARPNPFAYALVPRYRHERGHPVALSPGLVRALLKDNEAENLSDAMRRNARLVGYLDVADPGVVINRNTPGS
jgi:CTP:molybdopterin cytidylyltransferase MocA